ncbi:hypothetical protein OIU84_010788 [Salix udensis]|uniref:Pectinesterase inhibitor domain-containing protein n=1 Tax=Salix udensis TaxID=889485 RepID=A0AAD6JLN0_9ROSI|nr:hypothetical protein OIU84_010788 [Salix udensis]
MVFQDFDQLSERRSRCRSFFPCFKSRYQQPGKQWRRITISCNSACRKQQKPISHVARVIKTVCNATTYQDTCQNTLEKGVLGKDPSSVRPKDLLKIAIKAADEEIDKVIKKASSFKFDKPREKAAFDDCLELIEDAKEELKNSVDCIGNDIGKLASNAPDLSNWLNGSGDFKTISEALAAMPAKYEGRYVIFVKQGIYDETVTVTKKMANITMYGDGSQKTIVTGNKNFADGVQTFRTATFETQQVQRNIRLWPSESKLIVQYSSTVDLKDTKIPCMHKLTANSTEAVSLPELLISYLGMQLLSSRTALLLSGNRWKTSRILSRPRAGSMDMKLQGIVLQSCRIEADKDLVPVKNKIRSYLGRPWKEFSRTVIMDSTIGDFIHPDGWLPWQGDFGLKTLYYAEYSNKGVGAQTNARIKWPGYHIIKKEEAMKFTVETFYQGDWISASGSPVHLGL